MEKIPLSTQVIETQLQSMKLAFFMEKDDQIEWKTMPPMFIYSFYRFIAKFHRLPNQAEFWQFYLDENQSLFSEQIKSHLSALQARAFRAYPSFVRDVHFYYILAESDYFDQVLYHPEIDVKYGIDFIIKYKHQYFGVNCYISTPRSFQGREKKRFRHEKLSRLVLVDLPVHFKGSKKCGPFYLYSQRELNQLIAILNQHGSHSGVGDLSTSH
ncbi:MAG: hypothetical protein ONB32_05185 [candidate division KSB1 bacterium]|nr:hypothetical protein [candidate division KSB1 bacterium]MDZ7400956.1 hypothetical protein [candidate division KSB1 bacterium]